MGHFYIAMLIHRGVMGSDGVNWETLTVMAQGPSSSMIYLVMARNSRGTDYIIIPEVFDKRVRLVIKSKWISID